MASAIDLRLSLLDHRPGLPSRPEDDHVLQIFVGFDRDGRRHEGLVPLDGGGARLTLDADGLVSLEASSPMVRFRVPHALDPAQPFDRRAVVLDPANHPDVAHVQLASRRWLIVDVIRVGAAPGQLRFDTSGEVHVAAALDDEEQRRRVPIGATVDRGTARTAFFFDHVPGADLTCTLWGEDADIARVTVGDDVLFEGPPSSAPIRLTGSERILRVEVIPRREPDE